MITAFPREPVVDYRISFAGNLVSGVEKLQLQRSGASADRLCVFHDSIRRIKLILFGSEIKHIDAAGFVFSFVIPIAGSAAADGRHASDQFRMCEGETEIDADRL